jgi:ketosteroid isomerase-like protein
MFSQSKGGTMKKVIIIMLVVMFLSACGSTSRGTTKADVPDNAEAQATKSIVEKFISAYKSYDAEGLMSLYSDELIWMDYGLNDGPFDKDIYNFLVKSSMSSKDLKVEIESYIVTPDGRFAVLDTLFSMAAPPSGEWASVRAYAVLEILSDKIVAETWYYNGSIY